MKIYNGGTVPVMVNLLKNETLQPKKTMIVNDAVGENILSYCSDVIEIKDEEPIIWKKEKKVKKETSDD
jgi:hypothetical protein